MVPSTVADRGNIPIDGRVGRSSAMKAESGGGEQVEQNDIVVAGPGSGEDRLILEVIQFYPELSCKLIASVKSGVWDIGDIVVAVEAQGFSGTVCRCDVEEKGAGNGGGEGRGRVAGKGGEFRAGFIKKTEVKVRKIECARFGCDQFRYNRVSGIRHAEVENVSGKVVSVECTGYMKREFARPGLRKKNRCLIN